jgi:hypothetical protein
MEVGFGIGNRKTGGDSNFEYFTNALLGGTLQGR